MKKSFLVFILVAISFLLLGQKEKESEQFVVEPEAPFKFVSQEFKGSVEQVGEFMKEFTKNFFDQQLIPNGQPMALFHNEPKNAADKEIKFELGFPVGDNVDVKVKPPLKIQEIQLPAVMKHVHVGPYEELFGVYEKLKGKVKQSHSQWGKGFTIHRFLNNPEYVKPEEIKTEVIVPLQGTPTLEIRKKPRLKTGESINYTVMYKSYRGSLDQIGGFVQDFLKEFFAQKVTPMGQPMIIFSSIPNSPKDKDLKMDIGFQVGEKENIQSTSKERVMQPPIKGKEVKPAPTVSGYQTPPQEKDVKSSLKVMTVRMDNVARQEHIGPYEDIFQTHQDMLQDFKRLGLKAQNTKAILVLLNNSTLVKPEEIKSEIIIPAEK